MGSQNEDMVILTRRQAAAVLGVSSYTIGRYIKNGSLRPVQKANHVGVYESDLLELQATWNKNRVKTRVSSNALELIKAEVRTLRREMDQVLRILNVRHEPLKLTNPEMDALYKTASQYSLKGWPPQVEEVWADHFLKLRYEHFAQLEKVIGDKHPWRPFFRLVSTMHLRPYNQELMMQFSFGRDHLLQMVQMWFEMKKISMRAFDRILREDARPSKVLLNKLGRVQSAKSKA